ncbi:MAG: MFS transporter [Rhodospirillaceae bacterium]|nr:MFS transporter [Rhodospirillaceae bacterium]
MHRHAPAPAAPAPETPPAGCEGRGGWVFVLALAVAQLVSWGALYYAFSLFVVPMSAELGWSRTALNGALSLGLLVAGLFAYPVGAWIDARGGRVVMSLGTAAATLLLVAWARVTHLSAFYLIWAGLGATLAATLYEPAFAVLTRRFPESFRTRITIMTLVGGFASTAFIPLTQLLIDRLGWREALLCLAAVNLAVAMPVHALLLRDGGGAASGRAAGPDPAASGAVARALRHPVFWCLALCFTAYFATFTALTFHFVPLLADRGVPTARIVGAFAVFGPSQVVGRLVLLALGRRVRPSLAGRLVVLAFPLTVLLLIALPPSAPALFAFAILFGLANGVMTIVRGTAVPDLLWREGYGAINGALALPATAARAGAPFAAAWLWTASGSYDAVLWALLVCALLSALGYWLAVALGGRPVSKQ